VTAYSSISIDLPDPHGAFITTVKPDGPAFRAGLQTGDIVQTFNGLRVDTYDDLTKIVSTTATGAVVELGVIRKKHRLDVSVQL
jgi:serine protease Do